MRLARQLEKIEHEAEERRNAIRIALQNGHKKAQVLVERAKMMKSAQKLRAAQQRFRTLDEAAARKHFETLRFSSNVSADLNQRLSLIDAALGKE